MVMILVLFSNSEVPASEDPRTYLENTPELQSTLNSVNSKWNNQITQITDLEHYGKREFWTFPQDDKGDCEDHAIPKKQALEKLGIQSFFAECKTETGRKHIVLMVFTKSGAFVLDNRRKVVILAKYTGYEWLKIQFPGDVWRSYETNQIVRPPKGYVQYKKRTSKEL